jgi:hypothetical protein
MWDIWIHEMWLSHSYLSTLYQLLSYVVYSPAKDLEGNYCGLLAFAYRDWGNSQKASEQLRFVKYVPLNIKCKVLKAEFSKKCLTWNEWRQYEMVDTVCFNHPVDHLRIFVSGILVVQRLGWEANSGVRKKYSLSTRFWRAIYILVCLYQVSTIHSLTFPKNLSVRGLARDSPSFHSKEKTLPTSLTSCYFIAIQADPHVLATWRSSHLRKWCHSCTKVNIPLAGGRTLTPGFSRIERTNFKDKLSNFAWGLYDYNIRIFMACVVVLVKCRMLQTCNFNTRK